MKRILQSCFLLFMLTIYTVANAQDKTVTGTVTSKDDGTPLPGVSVEVKGTKIATQTSSDGKYSINMPTGSTQLVFSYIGFLSKTVNISGKTANVSMDTDNKQLSEVVVVAYGTSKKQAITGSVATLSSAAIDDRVVTNITNVLQGVAPGIQVGGANGQPGATATVRIRGFGSISASNSPLYVVDGSVFDGSIGDINANDIESVSILKDASSSALYGARAANGVIMINTKKGKIGEPKMNVNVTQGFSARGIPEYDRVDAFEYYPAIWQAIRNSRIYPSPSATSFTSSTPAAAAAFATANTATQLVYNPFNVASNLILDANGKMNPNASLLYDDFDWFSPLVRTGGRTNADLNYSGNTGKSDYFVSLGYLNDEAYLKKSDFKRFNARMNVNTQVKKWLKTGLNLAGNLTDQNLAQDASTDNAGSAINVFNFSRAMGPIYPVKAYSPAGLPILTPTGEQFYDYGLHPGAVNRPGGALPGRHVIYETLLNDVLSTRVALNARTYAEIKFLKDFTFRPSVNIDLRQSNRSEFRSPIVGDGNSAGGLASRTNALTTSYTFNQLLTYDKSIGKHNINVLAGRENYDFRFRTNNASKISQVLSGNKEFANFVTPQTVGGFEDNYRIESYLSKASYNYDEKYFFDASLRRDATSRFSKDARYGTFFSVGGSWSINKEEFLKKATWIDDLRLKASYGEVGNDNILSDGNSQYYLYQAFYDLGFNNGAEPGILLSSAATPDLKWETIKTLNVGVAFSLFKSRITGEFEVFNRATTDLLFSVPQPLSNPVTTLRQNVGAMSNKGIELSLGGDVIRKKDFSWNLLTNSSIVKNEITKLPPGQPNITSGTKRYEVGGDIYQFYLRQYAGVDPSDGSALFIPTQTATTNLRTIDGNVYTTNFNNAEFAYMGSAIPDLFGAFTNTFNYKNLSLSVLVNYQIGGKFYDGEYASLMGTTANYGRALHKDALNAWTETNTSSPIPRLDITSSTFFTAQSSRWLVDASYMAISNINLAYRIPKKFVSKFDLSNVRVFASGENLALFTHRKGMNPTEAFTGVNSTTFTPARSIVFGLSVNL